MDQIILTDGVCNALCHGYQPKHITQALRELGIEVDNTYANTLKGNKQINRDLSKLQSILSDSVAKPKTPPTRENINHADQLLHNCKLVDVNDHRGRALIFKTADSIMGCGEEHTIKMIATLLAHTIDNNQIIRANR